MNFIEEYARKRPQYEAFVDKIQTILRESLISGGLKYQSIDGRAKSIDSFSGKAQRKDVGGAPKYDVPLEQISDLAGVRIILYTLEDVRKTCAFLEPIFSIGEKKNIGEEREAAGQFGYQSIHYLVELPDDLLAYPHYAPYRGLTCEIQVRTVLQHAWAEIEHDVQYKSQSDLPRTIKTQLRSLAGLLEIADREFQAIQDADLKLKSSVHETLQEDLTRDALSQHTGSPDETGNQTLQSVRELVHLRQYTDAIKMYDQKISISPTMHTLYIGRARARFLSGDVSGALSDLNHAKKLNPEDRQIEIIRSQIVDGNVLIATSSAVVGPYIELTNRGHMELEAGNGSLAFELYAEAEAAGGSIPFSRFNKAMACVVASDFDGARLNLGGLRLYPGTPMEINILALYAIADLMQGKVVSEEKVSELIHKRSVSNFSLPLSPMRHLEIGLTQSGLGDAARTAAMKVFDILRSASPA